MTVSIRVDKLLLIPSDFAEVSVPFLRPMNKLISTSCSKSFSDGRNYRGARRITNYPGIRVTDGVMRLEGLDDTTGVINRTTFCTQGFYGIPHGLIQGIDEAIEKFHLVRDDAWEAHP